MIDIYGTKERKDFQELFQKIFVDDKSKFIIRFGETFAGYIVHPQADVASKK